MGNAPIPSPTNAPLSPPTNAPVPSPTNAPLPPPTNAPIPSPTNAPLPPPTNAPVPSPTSALVSPTTNVPMPSPTSAPVPSPTLPPISSSGSYCCSNNYMDCNVHGWCGANQSRCEETCSAKWIETGSCSGGIPRWGECTNNESGCCAPSTCQGGQYYKQCE